MKQLPLQMAPKLRYSGANFVVHEGVAPLYEAITLALRERKIEPKTRTFFCVGRSRSGKSHLAVTLAEVALSMSEVPLVLSGEEFHRIMTEGREILADLVLVDNADEVFENMTEGESGPYVRFAESMKHSHKMLVLFSTADIADLPCDDHVMSRLRGAEHLRIGAPGESELHSVLAAMIRQRGLELAPKKIKYIARRIDRSVAAIEAFVDRMSYLSEKFGRPFDFQLLHDAV